MDSEVQTYVFDSKEVRMLTIDDEPWFVGKDVATVLGYSNHNKVLKDHVDDEDSRGYRIVTPSGTQTVKVINESGLYSLILSSKLPTAKRFKRWVTNEVLPSIRKHGMYATDKVIDQALADPDSMIRVLTELKKEREQRLLAEREADEFRPKAKYCDLILQNKSLLNISAIAKDYGMSGAKMNQTLHELKVQFKQGGIWLPYSKYQKEGWTKLTTRTKSSQHGGKTITYSAWTQKGRLGIYEILKEHGILPLIEQEEQ